MQKFELYKSYALNNGTVIELDGISNYLVNFREQWAYTSSKHHGQWDKNGSYLTSVLFTDEPYSEFDIDKEIKDNGKRRKCSGNWEARPTIKPKQ